MPGRCVLRMIAIVVVCLAGLAAQAQPPDPLVGVWRGQLGSVMGPMQVELILMADGTYSQAAVAGSVMTRHWGHWRTFPGVIRLDIEGASPTEWCGPLGCTQLQWPEGETWQYDMPDPDTLRTVNGVLYRSR